MKRFFILILTGFFAQFMASCYPEGAEYVEDYDVAMTNYDKMAKFSDFTTFAIPDSIVHFSNDEDATIDHKYDDKIIELVTKSFVARGYTLEADTSKASFIVTVSAFSNVNYVYYLDNWYDRWDWYWGSWWGNSFDPYYPWYPVNAYSYSSGSVVIDMISTTKREDNKVDVVWNGIADGLLQGSDASIITRLEKQINQCFTQSPYLKK